MNEIQHGSSDPIGAVDGHDVVSGKPIVPLGHHELRRADIDPKAAIRAERQVATMFSLSSLMIVSSIVAFIKVPNDTLVILPLFGPVNANHITVGSLLGLGIFLIGTGAIHWAKKLMPDVEVTEERHAFASSAEDKAAFGQAIRDGKAASGVGERKIIRRSLLGALALFPLPLVVFLRDLGPMPNKRLRETIWDKDIQILTDATYRPIRPEDIPIGGLVNALPANLLKIEEEDGNLNERGKASIILIRMAPADIVSQQGEGWDYQGILAYSKICTHVGCPISLYQQRTHHLLCPCHQSTFDLADSGNVVFGPAARRMPQLPITVNAQGYLVAASGFKEPIGPSFWERG